MQSCATSTVLTRQVMIARSFALHSQGAGDQAPGLTRVLVLGDVVDLEGDDVVVLLGEDVGRGGWAELGVPGLARCAE